MLHSMLQAAYASWLTIPRRGTIWCTLCSSLLLLLLTCCLLAVKSPHGTCVLDSDCPTATPVCGGEPRRICRCINGGDSCEKMSVCVARPPAIVPEPPLSNCDNCKRCISWVGAWQATGTIDALITRDNSMALATAFLQRCTTNFTANDAVRCRGIAGAIAFSFNGNLAKRAGALCHHLGNCTGAAATSSCNVTADAPLDLCSKEGYVGGAVVAGLAAAGQETCSAARAPGGSLVICDKLASGLPRPLAVCELTYVHRVRRIQC